MNRIEHIEPQSINQTLSDIYNNDRKVFDDFVNSKSPTIDYSSVKRLILSEMALKKMIRPARICNFTRKQILQMCQYPEQYGTQILRLMNYMYQKSGYVRRLIDYFSNMAKANFYVDTEIINPSLLSDSKTDQLKKNYMKFCFQASKFDMSGIINSFIRRMYLNDVCYAYVVETDIDISYFFIDPQYCEIRRLVSGNIFEFAINRSLLSSSYFETLPIGLQNLITQSAEISPNNLVDIPFENAFCLKYNDHYLHLFPPFFPMIADILLIDEYKDLSKTKAINDAYKLLVLKVPTKDGKLTMADPTLAPFIETALKVVQDNIGVLPYPGDVESVEFAATNSEDRDKVSDATTWAFAEAGVSQALLSGASSGSELKLSITNDSGDVFRIYRMIENWISLQMKLRGFIYKAYRFVYKLLDITIFNSQEVIDSELKLAQASIPNKQRLCASTGMSPTAMLGNIMMEQIVFKNVYDLMQPLKSSYVQSGTSSSDEGGRPLTDDGNLSQSGEQTREGNTNDPANRDV